MTADTMRIGHTMDTAHWDQLKRSTRARLASRGQLIAPLPPGVHDVEYDTHRTRAQRERAGR
ncbi:hypothetical protein MT344_00135 [Clavibacter michiganensis subsp. phaseoli]|jgi:hypothetical protein|uniref:Uncharacterized protein n=1 Tax=Clavibacter phaseoli TaxID=1734031 RepID=A0A8I0S948_9MICO|nr:hypothetical protein [Clavibacter phaseoli]MBF4631191.1 hypothetical protein [Clavibacter phaseoli]MCJ1709586.1 hypothetical protein [Clavibacter phaseoli]